MGIATEADESKGARFVVSALFVVVGALAMWTALGLIVLAILDVTPAIWVLYAAVVFVGCVAIGAALHPPGNRKTSPTITPQMRADPVAIYGQQSMSGHEYGGRGVPPDQPQAEKAAARVVHLFGEPDMVDLLLCTTHEWIEVREESGRRGLYAPKDVAAGAVRNGELVLQFGTEGVPGSRFSIVCEYPLAHHQPIVDWLRRLGLAPQT